MKNITSTILLSLSITGGVFTSCDIDRFPNNYMATDQVADNQEILFDNMLNGMYAQLKTWSDPMHRLGEYAGDNMGTKPSHRLRISSIWPKIQMIRKLKANWENATMYVV